jgi:hypothetical protein
VHTGIIDVASKMKVSKNNSCGRPSYAEYRAIEKNLSKLHIIVLNERTESNRVIAVLSERKEFLIVKTKKMRQWAIKSKNRILITYCFYI